MLGRFGFGAKEVEERVVRIAPLLVLHPITNQAGRAEILEDEELARGRLGDVARTEAIGLGSIMWPGAVEPLLSVLRAECTRGAGNVHTNRYSFRVVAPRVQGVLDPLAHPVPCRLFFSL